MEPGPTMQQSDSPSYIPVPPLPPPLKDVTSLLTPGALERLRRAYSQTPHQVANTSIDTITGMYEKSTDLLQEMLTEFYEPQDFARDREQIVIALLAARMGNRRMYLALHFYWGLMVGLDPKDIAYRLLFVSFYSGIDTLTSSLETLAVVLKRLEQHTTAASSDDALEPQTIMAMLKTLFP
ncbi:hypothetical protein [Pyxidicoccus sp. MSG2]|uniref:hypothetical protein n=1 Tax=Pyxidicoccus sp. MSG2 TaxID=2996790 RepID=UPI00226FCE8E|nr:hypothetical protein [Pyxidicoccus sp. MSG2]MCY1019763.1 hypothetical protein [Pyxidicoccus sp. MSG2]